MAMKADGIGTKYEATQDRESAYEMLKGRAEKASKQAGAAQESSKARKTAERPQSGVGSKVAKSVLTSITYSVGSAIADAVFGTGRKSAAGRAGKAAVRSATTSILRGVLGSMAKR